MAVEHLLDFERGNILATGNDDVLGAVLDLDVAVLMPDGEIA